MSSLPRRSRDKGKAKGFKSPRHWPSTADIDFYVWNLSEPTGPSAKDAQWAAANLNDGGDYHTDETPPDEVYDLLADEAAHRERIERGYRD